MSALELMLVVLWLGGLAGLMISWLVHRRRERRLRWTRERLDAKVYLAGLTKRDVQ